jgi:hypothetical protein
MLIPILIALLMAVPATMVVEATTTGTQKELCENTLKGKYVPAYPPQDVCPGGSWTNIIKAPK